MIFDLLRRRAYFVLMGVVISLILVWGAMAWHRFFLAHSTLVPSPGGILTESTIGTVQNINPLAPNTSLLDRDLQKLLFSGLLRYDPLTGAIENDLAELQIAEDGKIYYLKLRKSARWHDGEPVTVEDVLFTFEQVIQNPHFSNTVLRDAFEYVTLEVIDERTVGFILPERNVYFLSWLTTPLLPHQHFQDVLIEEVTDPSYPYNKKPIGTGPFQLKNIVPNDDGSARIFLKKNPSHYRGEPFLEQLVIYAYPSMEHLMVTHEWTTLFSRLPFEKRDEFVDFLAEKPLETDYELREYVLPRWLGFFFNLDTSFGTRPSIRNALTYALDKEKLTAAEPGWSKVDTFFFFEGVESWHEPDYPFARRKLRDNGLKFNKAQDIRLTEKGDPVVLRMVTSTTPSSYSRFAQGMTQTWESELDVDIDLQILEPDDFQKAIVDRAYDIVLFGQNFSKNFNSLSTWHSSQSGKFNLSNLTNNNIDFLIEEIRFSGAQSDMFQLSRELEELIPAVPLATPEYALFINPKLRGFSEHFGKIRSHADRFSDVQEWYFEEELDWHLEGSKVWGFVRWIFSGEDKVDESISLRQGYGGQVS